MVQGATAPVDVEVHARTTTNINNVVGLSVMDSLKEGYDLDKAMTISVQEGHVTHVFISRTMRRGPRRLQGRGSRGNE
ncbi:hypothetical protein VNO78_31061 [Psophocarpus tetragonolobus]|uniref:Uncharacterized protein n=1 Tax=Psophocarpus tetragonolobus TaxID=3891 RepID=A0AAN9RXR8_PSOTE